MYSLEGFASPGLRSQLHKSMNIYIYIYTHYAHCFSFGHADKSYFDFDWSEFDVTTIFDSTCKKDQKQKAEFNLYLYIYIFMIGDDMSILKTEKNIEGNAHQILRPFLQIKVIFSNR